MGRHPRPVLHRPVALGLCWRYHGALTDVRATILVGLLDGRGWQWRELHDLDAHLSRRRTVHQSILSQRERQLADFVISERIHPSRKLCHGTRTDCDRLIFIRRARCHFIPPRRKLIYAGSICSRTAADPSFVSIDGRQLDSRD